MYFRAVQVVSVKLLRAEVQSPLARIGALLEKPGLLQLVPEDSFEAFLQASERLQLQPRDPLQNSAIEGLFSG